MVNRLVRKTISSIRPPVWSSYYNDVKSLVTDEHLSSFKETCLKSLLVHAYKNVPYYNRILGSIGLIQHDEVDLSKFGSIPILNKKIIRENWEDLNSKDKTKRRWYYNSSGGSTGEPIKLVQDNSYNQWGQATTHYYYYNILGIDLSYTKKIILWGSERDLYQGTNIYTKFVRWLNNSILLNSFKMTKDDLSRYVRIINSYKPELIRGYAGSLYELCDYVEKTGLQLYNPTFIISSAEMLSDDKRVKIERVFGNKVYDFYGSREISNLAGECKLGLMHTFNFNNYIEVLDSQNRQVKEGEEGRVVVTNLHNYSMPLIRYEIGDLAVLGPTNCPCSIPLPTLKKVTGRIGEHLVTEEGTLIYTGFLTITFNFKEWVRSFQIVQEDYKLVRIFVVLQSEVNIEDIKEINNMIRFLLGQDCKIIWDYVEEIPKTPQGKHLYVRSLIPR